MSKRRKRGKNKLKDKYRGIKLPEIILRRESEIRESMSISMIYWHKVTRQDGELMYRVCELRRTKAVRYQVFERDRGGRLGRTNRVLEAIDDGSAHRVASHRIDDIFHWWNDGLDSSVSSLSLDGLDGSVINPLKRHNYQTIGDVVKAIDSGLDLALVLNHFGDVSYAKLKAALVARGYFKDGE